VVPVSFADRVDAGRRLAGRLEHLRGGPVVVLGLPRGGVPVAAEVARALGAPLDVIVVRKLGAPFQPELAMGAIGEDGIRVLNDDVLRLGRITDDDLAAAEARERTELERRAERFRSVQPMIPLEGQTAVIVDDGIATGSTAAAACRVARAHGAAGVVLAVPVGAPTSLQRLTADADQVVVVEAPEHFQAVGQFYDDFSPTTEEEVLALLRSHRSEAG
jgi:putative phosphoribosyl transferase